MNRCNYCVNFIQDKETGYKACNLEREEFYNTGGEGCPEFRDEQAAKDDAKYGSCEKY